MLKQVAQPLQTDKHWAALALSLEDHSAPKDQLKLEGDAVGSIYAPQRFAPPERQAAAMEVWTWISLSTERLSEDDQRVLQAVGDVENGQAATLGEALGVKDGAARMRKQRWLDRLTSAAITEGNREMALHPVPAASRRWARKHGQGSGSWGVGAGGDCGVGLVVRTAEGRAAPAVAAASCDAAAGCAGTEAAQAAAALGAYGRPSRYGGRRRPVALYDFSRVVPVG